MHQRDHQDGKVSSKATNFPLRFPTRRDRGNGSVTRIHQDRDSGRPQRHHLHENLIQRAVRFAVSTSSIKKHDPLARGRVRHPDGPRALGTPRCEHHDDLRACPEPGSEWGSAVPPTGCSASSVGDPIGRPGSRPRLAQNHMRGHPLTAPMNAATATADTIRSTDVRDHNSVATALNPMLSSELMSPRSLDKLNVLGISCVSIRSIALNPTSDRPSHLVDKLRISELSSDAGSINELRPTSRAKKSVPTKRIGFGKPAAWPASRSLEIAQDRGFSGSQN